MTTSEERAARTAQPEGMVATISREAALQACRDARAHAEKHYGVAEGVGADMAMRRIEALAAAPAPLRADAGEVERLCRAAEGMLAGLDAYNEKHGTYIGGPAAFELARAVAGMTLTTPKPEAPQGEEPAPRQGEGEIERLIASADRNKSFVTGDDGFEVYWPTERSGRGAYSAWMLRALADELDRRNGPWEKEVRAALQGDADHG